MYARRQDDSAEDRGARSLFTAHQRDFAENRYVYPVLSRRAGGISIGVNINVDKACNSNCIYCQIDRTTAGKKTSIDLDVLAGELRQMIELVTSGRIFEQTKFRHTPPPLRRLCDIAISGDGEPTACHDFERVAAVCAKVRPPGAKLVLITNTSLLHRENVRRGLEILDANNGEIWAKLDAGTEPYYRQVSRSNVPYQQILDNLRQASLARPIIIQTLFMLIDGQSPSMAELKAYCGRLNDITAAGGRIKQVQIHTVARQPAEKWVSVLPAKQINTISQMVEQETGLPVMQTP